MCDPSCRQPCNNPQGKEEDTTPPDPRDDGGNFYNNWNVDYRKPVKHFMPARSKKSEAPGQPQERQKPGDQPCVMKMIPPPDCCDECGWKAVIGPSNASNAKPKARGKEKYVPGPCRPGCLHWQPKGGFCKYSQPCRADCFLTPAGMRANHSTSCPKD